MISSFMLTDLLSPELTPQFYDATKVTEKGAQNAKVTWIGFPRKVRLHVFGGGNRALTILNRLNSGDTPTTRSVGTWQTPKGSCRTNTSNGQ